MIRKISVRKSRGNVSASDPADRAVGVDVDALGRGPFGQAGHAHDLAGERHEKPAPAAISISRTWTVNRVGRPRSLGLSESESWVLAMQMGSCP